MRRTAWGMLLGGLLVTALMFGAGILATANAAPAGPGEQARWPAEETATVQRALGEPPLDTLTIACTVTSAGRPAEREPWFGDGDATAPTFPGDAMITCEERVVLLVGAPRVIAEYTLGPLIALPMFVALLGGLLFVPRFAYLLATISTRGWMRRMLRSPPPS